VKAFIIFRDRVTYARRCMTALLAADLEPVVVDHGSTWPEAVTWLEHLDRSAITVLRREGGHPRGLQAWPPFRKAAGSERYIATDPDVVPSGGCPRDWPQHLGRLLDAYPAGAKAGLGLRTDNLPDHYSRKRQVIEWEAQFWQHPVGGDGAYWASIDTTLAMYREESGFQLEGAIRTGAPYLADHLPWHENLENLTAEQRYYYEHAERGVAHWAPRGLSAWGD
jgi:hypothetical protein